jgi:transposase
VRADSPSDTDDVATRAGRALPGRGRGIRGGGLHGWRYVAEELGRLPESQIPPTYVLEIRTLARLYCTLMEERRAWQQRIHTQLFHQGCPPIRALLTEAGRAALATADLSQAGRQYVDMALRRIDALTDEIEPPRTQLVSFAKRQPGCRALQARHYGVGWLCAVIIWAEIGDARRFANSDQVVRLAGMDVTGYSSDTKRSPGHLSQQGSPRLRWAVFQAAKCAARPCSLDYTYYHRLSYRADGNKPGKFNRDHGSRSLRSNCKSAGRDWQPPPSGFAVGCGTRR